MKSLILAGGGLKVAYQAGCLQVLLDEAGLEFDHVDAASGGCFNAALMASGRSGTEIAELWRTTDPRDLMSFDLWELRKLLWARSLGTSDGIRHVLRDVWKVDYRLIRACTRPVFTFNHINFSRKRVEVVENRCLDEDLLVASVSLLVWVPAVRYAGDWLFDAVWCTDGNVGEAVRRGANEIWAIWTVSDTPELRDGFLAQYFHLIETVANIRFWEEWREIEVVNAGIAANGAIQGRTTTDLRLAPGFDVKNPPPPPPGRVTILQHLIEQEVGMHYLFNMSRDRAAAAVELGIANTRKYLQRKNIPFQPAPKVRAAALPDAVPFAFRETIRGFFMPGCHDPVRGARDGKRAGNALELRLTIATRDLDALLHDPSHPAAIEGEVEAPVLCGSPMKIVAGAFHAFVDDRAPSRQPGGIDRVVPTHKRFFYDLRFRDAQATAYVLKGEKRVNDEPGHWVWPDTTTVFTRLWVEDATGNRTPFGAGIVRVHLLDFLANLLTFSVDDGDRKTKARAIARYLTFFVGRSWDVYARAILDYAPF